MTPKPSKTQFSQGRAWKMCKKTVVLLAVLLFPGIICTVCADVPGRLAQARGCYHIADYENALQIYQAVVSAYPGSNYALEAQKDIVILYIAWREQSQADEAYQNLLTSFIQKDLVSAAVCEIGHFYRYCGKYQKAIQLYQNVLTLWPDQPQAMWAQWSLAMVAIELGDQPAAQAEIDKLVANFSANEHIATALCDAAARYRGRGQNDQANRLYQYVLDNAQNWEGTSQAMWSKAAVAIANIELGNSAAADNAVAVLIGNFPDHEHIADALCQAAHHFKDTSKYARAKQLYQYILNNFPDSDYAMWAQAGLAVSNISLGSEEQAQAAVDKLIDDFAHHSHIANGLYDVAAHYRWLGEYQKAIWLCQYVLDHWPNSQRAIWARMDLARSYIGLGDETSAHAQVSGLTADFADHPDLPEVLFWVGEQYHAMALQLENDGQTADSGQCLQKAVAVWEIVIDDLPSCRAKAMAYDFAAESYYRLGNFQKAIDYYQQLISNWPGYEYAWNAQFHLGRSYEKLLKAGLISQSEADGKIRVAYQKLVADYPDCKPAKYARRWLAR